jgi:hypothetical protein
MVGGLDDADLVPRVLRRVGVRDFFIIVETIRIGRRVRFSPSGSAATWRAPWRDQRVVPRAPHGARDGRVLTVDVPTLCRALSANSERIYGSWSSS